MQKITPVYPETEDTPAKEYRLVYPQREDAPAKTIWPVYPPAEEPRVTSPRIEYVEGCDMGPIGLFEVLRDCEFDEVTRARYLRLARGATP